MKKSKKYIIAGAAAAAVLIITVCILLNKGNTEFEKYQYTTCVLINSGLYDEARQSACETLEIEENEKARVLVAITYMLEGKYDKAERYAQVYLNKPKTDAAKEFLELMTDSKATSVDYLYLVEDISGSISTDKAMRNKVKAIVEAKKALAAGSYELSNEVADELESSNDAASCRLLAQLSVLKGNSDEALTWLIKAEDISNSLSDKTAVAQLVASGVMLKDWDISDIKDNTSKAAYARAVNYLLALGNDEAQKSVNYQLVLSRMYFYSGEDAKASISLSKAMTLARDKEVGEYAAQCLNDYITAYSDVNVTKAECEVLLQKLIETLTGGFLADNNPERESDGKDYRTFVEEILNEKSQGISIGYIDAREFPTIRVGIDASDETALLLMQEDIVNIYDSGEAVTDVNISSTSEEDSNNVFIVLDTGADISEEELAALNEAAKYFVRNVQENINTGLITFNETAEIECQITNSSGIIIRQLENVTKSSKSSNIAAGIEKALEEFKDCEGKKTIILMAQENAGGDISEAAGNAKSAGVQIFCIAPENAENSNLRKIAEVCGGKLFNLGDTENLGSIYKVLGEYMTSDIIIEYTVKKNTREYSRDISITVSDGSFSEKEYTVGLESGYYLNEQEKEPASDLYRQTGGSYNAE